MPRERVSESRCSGASDPVDQARRIASSFLVPPAARERPEAKIWPEAVYLAGGSVSEVAFDHPHGEIRIFSPFVHKLSCRCAFRFNRLNGAFLNAGGSKFRSGFLFIKNSDF